MSSEPFIWEKKKTFSYIILFYIFLISTAGFNLIFAEMFYLNNYWSFVLESSGRCCPYVKLCQVTEKAKLKHMELTIRSVLYFKACAKYLS